MTTSTAEPSTGSTTWTLDSVHDRHSRSRAAGYVEELLDAARVAVIGVGALGQNVVQSLALAGVGHIGLVDFDDFEDQNITRSPLYPSRDVLDRTTGAKALGVAETVRPRMSATSGTVDAHTIAVQRLPLGILRSADVVVAAVDSMSARRWLGRWCRVLGVPLVEGGFEGSRFNMTVYGVDADAACLACLMPDGESAMSCQQAARLLAGTGIVPALQTTACVLGGLMTEAVIGLLHGRDDHLGRLVHGDVRTPELRSATISRVDDCSWGHDRATVGSSVPVPASWADLAGVIGEGSLVLPSPVVLSAPCPACDRWCRPNVPDHEWMRSAFCESCVRGGHSRHDTYPAMEVIDEVPATQLDRLAGIRLADVGLVAGGLVTVRELDGALHLVPLPS